MFTVENVARICHEANRALCFAMDDKSQPLWDLAPMRQKDSAINGVQFRLDNPDITSLEMHRNWLKQKEAEGWKFGPEKNVDAKLHPCMLPYNHLPAEQQLKDHLFKAIVDVLRDSIETGDDIGEVSRETKTEAAPIPDPTLGDTKESGIGSEQSETDEAAEPEEKKEPDLRPGDVVYQALWQEIDNPDHVLLIEQKPISGPMEMNGWKAAVIGKQTRIENTRRGYKIIFVTRDSPLFMSINSFLEAAKIADETIKK